MLHRDRMASHGWRMRPLTSKGEAPAGMLHFAARFPLFSTGYRSFSYISIWFASRTVPLTLSRFANEL